MIEAFRNGGWGMFPTALFGVICLLIAARHALRPERRLIPLQLALGVVTVLTGCLGFVAGLITTTNALHQVPESRVALIGALGFGESLHNVALALILVVLAALCTSVGVLRETGAAGAS